MNGLETACVAMGSNVGDRERTIRSALRHIGSLNGVRIVAASSLHETAPIGPPQGAYINAVVRLETSDSPEDLLRALLGIEHRHGRVRSAESRWGPRTLDLDLVLFGDRVIDVPGLKVPHPRMHERRFVLAPLAEVAAEIVHPILHRTVQELLDSRAAADTEWRGEPPFRAV